MATVLIPHSWNQSARRWRSSVKVPNVRTGSEARSGPTAATCIFDPTSMAAARGWMADIARDGTGLFVPVMPASPCVAKQREGLDCAGYQFPNRDHREASPLSSAQQSMDHVFLRDHPPPKICRPLPSAVRFYRGTVSLATGGPARVFLKEMPELVQFHHDYVLARLWLRARRVRCGMSADPIQNRR